MQRHYGSKKKTVPAKSFIFDLSFYKIIIFGIELRMRNRGRIDILKQLEKNHCTIVKSKKFKLLEFKRRKIKKKTWFFEIANIARTMTSFTNRTVQITIL